MIPSRLDSALRVELHQIGDSMSNQLNPMTAAGLAALPGVPTGFGIAPAHSH
jgi:ABC-type iron transport system FetAB permease component